MNFPSPALPQNAPDACAPDSPASAPDAVSPAKKRGFDFGQFVSRTFNFLYVIGSFALVIFAPFEVNDWNIVRRTLWLAFAAIVNFSLVQGFKYLCYVPRPGVNDKFCWGRRHHSGFPSGHTLPAFMLATMVTMSHPHLWFWFFGASLIAWARWHVKAHYAYQVILSALVGVCLGLFVGHFLR